MALTWVVTLPAAAGVGALTFAVINGIGGDLGVVVMALVLAAFCGTVFLLSRKNAVTAANVNDDWDEQGGPSHEPAMAA
jgi:PiT family inorganic phosphate transporter